MPPPTGNLFSTKGQVPLRRDGGVGAELNTETYTDIYKSADIL